MPWMSPSGERMQKLQQAKHGSLRSSQGVYRRALACPGALCHYSYEGLIVKDMAPLHSLGI